MPKQTIAVDIDDVLAGHAQAMVVFSNECYGTNLHIDDYDEHFGVMWQTEEEETERRAQEWHLSGRFRTFAPIASAKEVLTELHKDYRLVIITSRRKMVTAHTNEWLDENFAEIFDEVHFAGFWDDAAKKNSKEMIVLTKGALAKEIKADYLIDDQLKHCVAVAELGIEALLFGGYAWNKVDALPKGITRAKDWRAVKEYFDAKS